ncbi:hypothetical protein FB45DRAFT_1005279 [Roridomyces roridus]|uniref:Uncharacterized protein n=1 Tax=Roridomyces roridus TaxID=1738132 RepID=A0AAD7BNK4_9AGAR|nr:hypothetical protein FB45DRAFT_1005279 [Roridomyces roridus]
MNLTAVSAGGFSELVRNKPAKFPGHDQATRGCHAETADAADDGPCRSADFWHNIEGDFQGPAGEDKVLAMQFSRLDFCAEKCFGTELSTFSEGFLGPSGSVELEAGRQGGGRSREADDSDLTRITIGSSFMGLECANLRFVDTDKKPVDVGPIQLVGASSALTNFQSRKYGSKLGLGTQGLLAGIGTYPSITLLAMILATKRK